MGSREIMNDTVDTPRQYDVRGFKGLMTRAGQFDQFNQSRPPRARLRLRLQSSPGCSLELQLQAA